MSQINFHPLAELFPLMEGESFVQLVEDIRTNGLREEILTHDGQIIDGRNRYRACVEASVEPRFKAWDGHGDPIRLVVSLNLNRRHLNESQRAMVAAKIATLKNGHRKQNPSSPTSIDVGEVPSIPEAAKMMNVGECSVDRARRVQNYGIPELAVSVERGEVGVYPASVIAKIQPERQKEIVAAGPKAIKAEAAKIRAEKRAETNESTELPSRSEPPSIPAKICISVASIEQIQMHVDALFEMVDRPWSQVSTIDLKNLLRQLRSALVALA